MHQYVLVLGSNIEPKKHLKQAIFHLQKYVRIDKVTEVISTPPYLNHDQAWFLNQGLLIETNLLPSDLLRLCKKIEQEVGRKKRARYQAREIDIDIVYFSGGKVQLPDLILPHPANFARFWVRHFLAELIPDMKDADTLIPYRNMDVQDMKSIQDFARKKTAGEKITILTCYDYTMAKLISQTSLDAVLVGDSLGMVMKGEEDTLAVSIEEMIYHTKAVRRAIRDKVVIADMPFLSYQVSKEKAIENAGRILQQSGASAVKLEGGEEFADVISALVQSSIPVMGHIGLKPQSIRQMGGYFLVGKEKEVADRLVKDALALQEAGCFALVAEMIPASLCKKISHELAIPVIGIGSGPFADGQVLVLQDMLGLNPEFSPKFLRRFANLGQEVKNAVEHYCHAVRQQEYPSEQESY
ncbi:MAG: 3-methyl-2-oxobutanoate hydroxymethyltransferase [Candidatus Hydrogenedentota bacterium]|nr:MAG: 3-methyl-2-oxobutanoate hydroxymethyltransferase [Candidatus Hydrogenedentota bacterium]